MKKKILKKRKNKEQKITFPDWNHLKKFAPYLILLITLGALFVRIYRVGFLSVWLDEYMHINPALDILNGREISESDINGIFLTWVVTLFFKIFGISELVARIPSVLFGAATIPLIYFFTKKLYNRSIGLMASTFAAFSLYLICWSRIARNYASFGFSYILLLIVIWLTFHSIHKKQKESGFWYQNNINTRYLLILPLVFIFSLINHQLTFFVLFGLSIYILINAIVKIVRKTPNRFTNIYAILSYFIILGLIIFFTPALLDKVARPILGILLPERIINWILPDWSYIIGKLKSSDEAFKSFIVYFNVLKSDFSKVYYLGFLGIITSFFIRGKKQEAIYLFSMFVVPFLLMSFVFRDPSTPNYIYYIYPIFLIYISISIYFIVKYFFKKIFSQNLLSKRSFNHFILLLIILLIIIAIPSKEIKSLITTKEHGQVVKKELFYNRYINWKSVCNQIKPYVNKEDVILSTWPSATNFYLNRNNSVWFRQRVYDTKLKKYVDRKPTNQKNSAYTLQELINTYKENKKGWLFADYYFHNIFTDPKARDFVIKNMDYHFNIDKDGEIKVFSWDHQRKSKYRNSMLIELGRNKRKLASKPLNFTIKSINQIQNSLLIGIDAEGIDKKNEAYVIINKKQYAVFNLHKNKSSIENAKRQNFTAVVKKEWLKEGQNTMQFVYNKDVVDYPKGYVIYNVFFKNQ
ncbi:MAG: glycosyltransferase family 39 protein [Bacteroidota bacterium]|nr:glycosyltransferase family 39 protein [Bacteroidota bacterium]